MKIIIRCGQFCEELVSFVELQAWNMINPGPTTKGLNLFFGLE